MLSENKTKKQTLDDFWDISELVPQKKTIRQTSKPIRTVEINEGSATWENTQTKLSDHVKRNTEVYKGETESFSYIPDNSLIHKVTLTKEKSSYEFYGEFRTAAEKLWHVKGEQCEYKDYFSYSPQYNQLSSSQMRYYLWWRENFREGRYLKTNLCYIYLYTFELINATYLTTPEDAREKMVEVLENYEDVLKGAVPRYVRWISDFSLIHRLPPPERFSEQLLKKAGMFKEYFVRIPGNTPEGWVRVLLAYCCSYDYRSSKFATSENIELFDEHVPRALARVVAKLSEDGQILAGLPYGDCKIVAKAFEGAVCCSDNRYTIEAEYCSFSRSHELRFLVGDVVKYAENKIRHYISVKSRLTVYSLPNDLRDVIDGYFATVLPHRRRTAAEKPKHEEYDILYDLPKKKLDLSNAERIEQESWITTKELVEAFEEEAAEKEVIPAVMPEVIETGHDTELCVALGKYFDAVKELCDGNVSLLNGLAESEGLLLDAVIDRINEIAVDIIGDIIIENDGDIYTVIEDYVDML